MRGPLNKTKVRLLCASAAIALMAQSSAGWAADMAVKATHGGPVPLAVGGWLFSPTLFAGAIYNNNVNQTEAGKVSSWGERITPGFTASLDNGIHQTSLYGLADIQNYSSSGVEHKTTFDAKAGITQTYLPQRDLTFVFNGDFTRQADVFGATTFASPNTPLTGYTSAPVAPTTVAPQVDPVRYNQYSGAGAVKKEFGRVFVALSGSVVATQYDSAKGVTVSRDGAIYTVAERTGFNLTPQLYAFVDPSVSWQRFSDSTRNSQGYRVTGGVGTAAQGLWMGEVYGGYQAQKNDIVGTYTSGVYGLRVGYSPTRMWDLRATLDETLGASTIATGGTTGVASRITTALLGVGYRGLPRGWSTSARFGYVRTSFIGSVRRDDGWLAGANVGYEIWRNLGVTLDYQYKSVNSNIAGQSFNQSLVSLGATYKY